MGVMRNVSFRRGERSGMVPLPPLPLIEDLSRNMKALCVRNRGVGGGWSEVRHLKSLAGQVPAPWALSVPSWERGRGPLHAEVLKPMRDTPRVWGHPSPSQEAEQGDRWGGTGHSGPQLWGGLDDKSRLPEAGARGTDREHSGPGGPTGQAPRSPRSPGSSASQPGQVTSPAETAQHRGHGRCIQVDAGMLLNGLLCAGPRPSRAPCPISVVPRKSPQ